MKDLSGIVAILYITVGVSAQPPAVPAAPLAIVNANLDNVRDGRITANATIVIRRGKIESIGPGPAPAGAQASISKESTHCRA